MRLNHSLREIDNPGDSWWEGEGEKVAGGERQEGGGEKEARGGARRQRGRTGEMKYEGWFSHKLPKAPLLTVFLFVDERTWLR